MLPFLNGFKFAISLESYNNKKKTKEKNMKNKILEILNKNKGVQILNKALENEEIDFIEFSDLIDEDDDLKDEIIEKIIDSGYSLDDDLARAGEAVIENCGNEIGYSASSRNAKDIEKAIDDFLINKIELETLANAIGQFIYKYECEELKEFLH